MMEYYKQTKEAALRALGSVLHQPVEDDHEAVHSALAAVLKHGTTMEAARPSYRPPNQPKGHTP